MLKTQTSVTSSSQEWEQLESNQAWQCLCRVLRKARDANRNAMEGRKISLEDIRFLQGENRFMNIVLEGDLRTFVGNALEKENSK